MPRKREEKERGPQALLGIELSKNPRTGESRTHLAIARSCTHPQGDPLRMFPIEAVLVEGEESQMTTTMET
jgi:hypothetical protein